MTVPTPLVETLTAGRRALAGTPDGARVEVVVADTVPGWLGDLVADAAGRGITVVVVADPPTHLAPEALAGWEIGVAAASLAAGAEVVGIDARRLARVAAVDRRWVGP